MKLDPKIDDWFRLHKNKYIMIDDPVTLSEEELQALLDLLRDSKKTFEKPGTKFRYCGSRYVTINRAHGSNGLLFEEGDQEGVLFAVDIADGLIVYFSKESVKEFEEGWGDDDEDIGDDDCGCY